MYMGLMKMYPIKPREDPSFHEPMESMLISLFLSVISLPKNDAQVDEHFSAYSGVFAVNQSSNWHTNAASLEICINKISSNHCVDAC